MSPLHSVVDTTASSRTAPRAGARRLYASLLGEHGGAPGEIDEVTRSASWSFLCARLDEAARMPSDLPDDPRALPERLEDAHRQTAAAYRRYLDERRAGAPRRFFGNRSHALAFLRAVAPTKLVDGAWLYGLLRMRADARLSPLIRTYLEELGDGVATRNHVLIYRRLLAANGCDAWQAQLDDAHYAQGAIQLALAHHADRLLPEVIGFNLGYEQLPLHLPITAYELNELDIDPHYFRLHVTIDNASTGHAQKALQAALDALPVAGDRRAFHRRMMNGYRLNELGVGTTDAIAAFDLERELVAVLTDRAGVGAQLHSDYCRIAGRTVTEWLSVPDAMPDLLSALASTGWIRRGRPVDESRFWRVLHDDRAPMFGVFDGYASQLLRDWIEDGAVGDAPRAPRHPNRFDASAATSRARSSDATPLATSVRDVVRRHLDATDGSDDEDVHALADRLAGIQERDDALAALRGWLSPANHPSPAGLLATRIYAALSDR